MQFTALLILAFSAAAIAAPAETPAQSTDKCYWRDVGSLKSKKPPQSGVVKGIIGCCKGPGLNSCVKVTPGRNCVKNWATICCPESTGVPYEGGAKGCRTDNYTRKP